MRGRHRKQTLRVVLGQIAKHLQLGRDNGMAFGMYRMAVIARCHRKNIMKRGFQSFDRFGFIVFGMFEIGGEWNGRFQMGTPRVGHLTNCDEGGKVPSSGAGVRNVPICRARRLRTLEI